MCRLSEEILNTRILEIPFPAIRARCKGHVTQTYVIQLAFLTPCDQAFNPPFLGSKIIELAKFCFKNKRFEPSLSFFSKQVIVSHCV